RARRPPGALRAAEEGAPDPADPGGRPVPAPRHPAHRRPQRRRLSGEEGGHHGRGGRRRPSPRNTPNTRNKTEQGRRERRQKQDRSCCCLLSLLPGVFFRVFPCVRCVPWLTPLLPLLPVPWSLLLPRPERLVGVAGHGGQGDGLLLDTFLEVGDGGLQLG